MLNPFPGLLVLSFFAPLLLRVTVAFVFLYLSAFHLRHRTEVAQELSIFARSAAALAARALGLMEGCVALALLVGFGAQFAALVGMVISLKVVFLKRGLRHLAPLSSLTYFLLFMICASLLLTGAGALALDLPL